MPDLIEDNGAVEDWFPYRRKMPVTTQVLALTENFDLICYLTCLNIQWIRRYYEFSEFSIQIMAKDYEKRMKYIFRDDRRQLMIIQKVDYNDSMSEGKVVQLSGYSFEFVLNDRIIYPRIKKTMNIELFARWLFENYKTEYNIKLGKVNGLGKSITMQESNDELGMRLFDMLQTQEMSWRIDFDMITNGLTFEVWQGLDRTQEQNKNASVTFSTGFQNLHDITAVIDNSNYKNYAIVVGNGNYEDGNQISVFVNKVKPGEIKHELYVDATSDTYDDENQTLEEFKASLILRGEEALDEHQFINELEFTAENNTFEYGKDFDLGDKCDIIIDDLQQSYMTRIVEIYETIIKGVMTTELIFGERTPTVYQKARLK